MPPAAGSAQHALLLDGQHLGTAQWYAVGGVVVGCLAIVVATAAASYKCYVRYRSRSSSERRQLSAAIRKGIREENNSTTTKVKRSPTGGFVKTHTPLPPSSERSPDQGHPPGPPQYHRGSSKEEDTSAAAPSGDSPQEKTIEKRECIEDKVQGLGSLHFGLQYDSQKSALSVTIRKACDLPVKDSNLQTSDPYVKLQLLPDKRHKVKTRVLRKTLNPEYDEVFTFYGLQRNKLQSVTLHFVVLSFDRFSRDDVIGEVIYPLKEVEIDKELLAISKDISPRQIKLHNQGRGEMLVSLCYQPAANRLTVVVLKARNLPKMDLAGLADPYVKVYLLYNGQRIAKKKTHVKKRTLNPVFNESFQFDVPISEGISNISVEFHLLDWDRVTKNDVIGGVVIGAKHVAAEKGEDLIEGHTQANHHWNEVMNCPRKQIAEWHKLKAIEAN